MKAKHTQTTATTTKIKSSDNQTYAKLESQKERSEKNA